MKLVTKSKLLIVDDIPENIHILMNCLKNDYDILAATNGKKAIDIVNKNLDIDIILLDIMMPDIDGYEVCRILKSSSLTQNIPIIFVTALNESKNEERGLELGAVDYITKPINAPLVRQRVKNHIELKHHQDNLKDLVEQRTKELKEAKEAAIEAMGIIAEKRDSNTGEHVQRVKKYVKLISLELAKKDKYKNILTKEYIENLYHTSPLHDIGKVAIKDSILLKDSSLTKDEFEEMKLHTIIGEQTLDMVSKHLKSTNMINIAKEIASSHHENWDGSGYPKGLKGVQIPLSARIVSVADVYDAMLHKRVYKEAISKEIVIEEIKKNSGIKFDPDIVDSFLRLLQSKITLLNL
ncbi:MAG: response regulator [Campylobacterota bacterium]|nr:response regulator [Campylobacterota bacterium]